MRSSLLQSDGCLIDWVIWVVSGRKHLKILSDWSAIASCNHRKEKAGDASALSKLNSWRLLKLIKIKSARSRLYRSRFLQVNTRWKALDEIYKIYILLHRSDPKNSANNRQHFFANELWISDFFIFCVEICIFSSNFWWIFVRISRQIPEKSRSASSIACARKKRVTRVAFSIKFAKTN